MSTKILLPLAPLLLGSALVACGGSGGSDSVSNPPPNDGSALTVIANDDGTDVTLANLPLAPLPDDTGDCSVVAQNQWVDAAMRDYYLYYDQVPVVDPATYASPEILLTELIVSPPDRFSTIVDRERFSNLYQTEGTRYGLGFRLMLAAADDLRIQFVDVESPAADAGMKRGERIVRINGESASSIDSDAAYVEAFGNGTPADARTVTLTLENASGEQRTVSVSTTEYPAFSAPLRSILDNENTGQRVGYILFDEILSNAADEIAAHLAAFNEQGVDDIIMDLRYNPGGLVSESLAVGTQIGGQAVVGQIAESIVYNDKYAERYNQVLLFPTVATTIDLPRLIFLTSKRSASAAELLINSLKPYKEVVVIGTGNTYGKATAFRANSRCDKVLLAVESTSLNSVGESVENGIPPDCVTRDAVERELGDPQESMLADALQYVSDGSCTSPATITASSGNRKSAESNNYSIGPERPPGAIIE